MSSIGWGYGRGGEESQLRRSYRPRHESPFTGGGDPTAIPISCSVTEGMLAIPAEILILGPVKRETQHCHSGP